MSWHYQIRRRKIGKEWSYDIVEQYSKPLGYTVLGVAPTGESRTEVIKCLEIMLKDVKKYKTLTEKEEKPCQDH